MARINLTPHLGKQMQTSNWQKNLPGNLSKYHDRCRSRRAYFWNAHSQRVVLMCPDGKKKKTKNVILRLVQTKISISFCAATNRGEVRWVSVLRAVRMSALGPAIVEVKIIVAQFHEIVLHDGIDGLFKLRLVHVTSPVVPVRTNYVILKEDAVAHLQTRMRRKRHNAQTSCCNPSAGPDRGRCRVQRPPRYNQDTKDPSSSAIVSNQECGKPPMVTTTVVTKSGDKKW